MGLIDLIRKNKNVQAATRQPDNAGTIARIATVAVASPKEEKNANDADIEKIRNWLYRIGEPEADHHLVIDKCKTDPEALIYFSRIASNSYSVTTESNVDDDRVRCSDIADTCSRDTASSGEKPIPLIHVTNPNRQRLRDALTSSKNSLANEINCLFCGIIDLL